MEVPFLTKNTATIRTSNSTPRYTYIGKTKTLIQKDIFTPMFIALFKTAKSEAIKVVGFMPLDNGDPIGAGCILEKQKLRRSRKRQTG